MKNEQSVEIAALQRYIGETVQAVEGAMREDLAEALQGNDPLLKEVIEYALFGGGKRIRPLLAILAARVCGNSDKTVYRLAAAFEYLHVATLVHDDVIDHALERRGRESVGRKYGMTAAILAGDWLHARSMFLVGRYGGKEGLAVFCRSTAGMVDGEFLQLRYAGKCTVTEKQYFDVIHRKTGLLIESTCEIGAIFAGAEERQRQALAEYGRKLGSAFQVIDDLLDYQGDSRNTGKAVGNDFVEGKMTLPLIRSLALAGEQEREKIVRLFAGARNRDDIGTVRDFIEKYDGFRSAREKAVANVEEAVAALDIFTAGADPDCLSVLTSLARYVLSRDR